MMIIISKPVKNRRFILFLSFLPQNIQVYLHFQWNLFLSLLIFTVTVFSSTNWPSISKTCSKISCHFRLKVR